jgi:outer membrane receptor protein involved in Fe transport
MLAVVAAAPGVRAQEAGAEAAAPSEQSIVVTGTRIKRDSTFDFPVPLATVDAKQIQDSGSAQLGYTIAQLPQIQPNNNLQDTSGTLFQVGQDRADIRGLGSVRTLVLVDGRRHIYTDSRTPGVDLNMIPSMMVDHIDVISGGASAVYGSDAISGVVNVILRQNLDGGVADAQVGETQEGDGEEQRYSTAYGGKLFDQRFHYLFGAEYSRVENIMQIDRASEGLYPGIRRDTTAGHVPQVIVPQNKSITGNVGTWVLDSTHSINIDPVTRTPNELTDPNCFTAANPNASFCQDPNLRFSQEFNELQGAAKRGTARGYVEYEITKDWKAFAEAGFAEVKGASKFQPAFSNTSTMPIVFHGDNGYLQGSTATDSAFRNLWVADGKGFTNAAANNAQVIKFWPEFGFRDANTDRKLWRTALGLDGNFELLGNDWSFDSYWQWAQVTSDLINTNQPWIARVQQAADAVLVNGQIQCRNNTNGCVPLNIIDGPSQAAINWVNTTGSATGLAQENVVSASVSGDLLQLPGGPLGMAAGAEYRTEKNKFGQDPLSASGVTFLNALGGLGGGYNITEEFVELRAPFLKDLPLIKELSAEYAYRNANYSTFGDEGAWRAVASWSPIQDITFRYSDGTGVRAPNVVELFAPTGQNFLTVRDPCDSTVISTFSGQTRTNIQANCAAAIPGYNSATFVSNIRTQTAQILTGGNPNLGPETATTETYGVVFKPRFLPHFNASFDAWHIQIDNAIGTLPAQTTIDLCYQAGGAALSNGNCAAVPRDPDGSITGTVGGVVRITGTNLNLAHFNVEGWDAAVQYALDLADINGGHNWGALAARVDVTREYRFEVTTAPGQLPLHNQNSVNNATPAWHATGSMNWEIGKFTLGWTTSFWGSQRVSTTLTAAQLNPYYTGDYYKHDLRVSYDISDTLRVRGGVLNITNEYPPYLPEVYTGNTQGSSVYDNRGRFFFIGADLKF